MPMPGKAPDHKFARTGLLLGVLLAIALAALAQRYRRYEEPDDTPSFAAKAEFHFIRMQYTDRPEFQRRFGFVSRRAQANGWRAQDWPDAYNNFSLGNQRHTLINTGDPRHVRLTDDDLFDYPWIYATQTGYWDLSTAETDRLREYLMRGGFLV